MQTILVVWLAWAALLWYLIRGPSTARRALCAVGLTIAASGVALADPATGSAASSDPLGDLQRTLTTALVGAVTAAVVALGKRAWDWVGHSRAGKEAEATVKQLHLDQALGDATINYVDQMERKLGKELSESDIDKHVRDFLASRGVVGDAVGALAKIVESQLGARHAAEKATNQLANAAKNFQDALATGDLAANLAKLRAMDAAATAGPAPLPPAPSPGGGKAA